MRIIAALRVLAYGIGYETVKELAEMSEDSVRDSFIEFVELVVSKFKKILVSTRSRRTSKNSWD